MAVDDMVRIKPSHPYDNRREPFSETIARHEDEADRSRGNLQPGPRRGERTPTKFRPDVDYTQTDAPDMGPLNTG